jgi:2-amino-4-hydroxy-6-hydroxymethyldihydropteridine diphosphokinase
MHSVYFQLGSNLGNREEYLEKAKELISNTIGKIVAFSSIFESEPWGFFASNWFLNQVIRVETNNDPNSILKTINTIEQELGRKREGRSYSSRTIDIDIILFDDLIINTPELQIPHPHMCERRFVLEPLAQIAPNIIHPSTGKTISKLLEECTDELEVRIFTKDIKPPNKSRCRI